MMSAKWEMMKLAILQWFVIEILCLFSVRHFVYFSVLSKRNSITNDIYFKSSYIELLESAKELRMASSLGSPCPPNIKGTILAKPFWSLT